MTGMNNDFGPGAPASIATNLVEPSGLRHVGANGHLELRVIPDRVIRG